MQTRAKSQNYLACVRTALDGCWLLSGLAVAVGPASAAAESSPVSASASASKVPAALAPFSLDDARSARIGQSLALGYDNGLWGSGFAQGLRLDVPLADHFALRARSILVHPPQFRSPWDPVVDSGLELIGRSTVLLRVLRVYGGGGLWLGVRPEPTSAGKKAQLSGGGFFGFEAFASPQLSFTFEVGGQGAGHALNADAGASVMGGVFYYFAH